MFEVKWTRSSKCDTGTCVEVGHGIDCINVRDSKNPDGPVLVFTPDEWNAFLIGVKADEFDL